MRVKPGDSWILMGARGSGKTTGLKYLDAVYDRLFAQMRHYVLDSKHDGDFDTWPGLVGGDTCPPKPGRNQKYQVWQPLKIIPEEVEKWLWGIRHDAPAVLEIDELVHLVYKAGFYSDEYNIIQKTGRGLHIGTITLSQELGRVPPNAYKQADHRLGFYIDRAAEYDTRIRDLLLKQKKLGDPKDQYGFWYQSALGRAAPQYFPKIQKFIGV